MRKVLIGTPTLDGKVDAWYCDSLMRTARLAAEHDVYIHAIYTSYDSLIQRSRNSLVKLALEQGFDDLIFIDSDVEWDPEWILKLLEYPEPVVGGVLVRKSDETEGYTVKITNKPIVWNSRNDLIEVDAVGTGFLKLSKFALQTIWDHSEIYYDDSGVENRMIFDIQIRQSDRELISEDYVFCEKWKSLGYRVWVDPTITCNHIGVKKYRGHFRNFLTKNNYV
jgi:hypothetical protein